MPQQRPFVFTLDEIDPPSPPSTARPLTFSLDEIDAPATIDSDASALRPSPADPGDDRLPAAGVAAPRQPDRPAAFARGDSLADLARGVTPVTRPADFRVDVVGEAPRSRSFLESLGSGVDQLQSMLYGSAEATAEALGLQRLQEWAKAGRERNDAEVGALPGAQEFLKITGVSDLGQWVKETVGNQVPIMGPTVAGGAVGAALGGPVGAAIGAFIPSLAMGVGEVQGAIKERGGTAPGYAFVGGSAVAALDSALPGKVGSRLASWVGREAAEQIATRALTAPLTESMVKRSLKGTAEGIFSEGLTEALQEAIGETATAYATNTPIDPALGTRMIEVAAAGALLGGATGVVPERHSTADVIRDGVGGKAAQDVTEEARASAESRPPIPTAAPVLPPEFTPVGEEPEAPPKTLYHITPKANRDAILRDGLLAGRDQTGYGGVFLTDNPNQATENDDVWEIPADALSAVEADPTAAMADTQGETWFLNRGDIPVESLRLRGGSTDSMLDRVTEKIANGQQLGSPELRAAFEQRQALDAARAEAEADYTREPEPEPEPISVEEAVSRVKQAAPPKPATDTRRRTVDESPAVREGRVTREDAYLLRWLVEDMEALPFQGSQTMTRGGALEADAEATSADESRQRRYAGRVAGSPTQQMFDALGVTSSRGDIANDIDRFLMGDLKKPTKAVQAALKVLPVYQAAWNGEKFDWDQVPAETMLAAGLKRQDLRSPVTLPPERQPYDLMQRYLGDAADQMTAAWPEIPAERKAMRQRHIERRRARAEGAISFDVDEIEAFESAEAEAPSPEPEPTEQPVDADLFSKPEKPSTRSDGYPPQPSEAEFEEAKTRLADEIATYRDLSTKEIHALLDPLSKKQAWWKKRGIPTADDYVRMNGLGDELVRRRQEREKKKAATGRPMPDPMADLEDNIEEEDEAEQPADVLAGVDTFLQQTIVNDIAASLRYADANTRMEGNAKTNRANFESTRKNADDLIKKFKLTPEQAQALQTRARGIVDKEYREKHGERPPHVPDPWTSSPRETEIPADDTMRRSLRKILDKAWPNFPRKQWDVEPGMLIQRPSFEDSATYRIDVSGDTPVVTSSKKGDRQLINFITATAKKVMKQHPNLRMLTEEAFTPEDDAQAGGPVERAFDALDATGTGTLTTPPSRVTIREGGDGGPFYLEYEIENGQIITGRFSQEREPFQTRDEASEVAQDWLLKRHQKGPLKEPTPAQTDAPQRTTRGKKSGPPRRAKTPSDEAMERIAAEDEAERAAPTTGKVDDTLSDDDFEAEVRRRMEAKLAGQKAEGTGQKADGKTKVVDAEGNPLTVYHGTTRAIDGPLRPDERGIFFTDRREVANDVYAGGKRDLNIEGLRQRLAGMTDEAVTAGIRAFNRDRRAGVDRHIATGPDEGQSPAEWRAELAREVERHLFDDEDGANQPADEFLEQFGVEPRMAAKGSAVYPATLNIVNPLDIDAKGDEFDAEQQREWLTKAKAEGHDGLIIRNYHDGGWRDVSQPGGFRSAGTHTVYVAFKADQVQRVEDEAAPKKSGPPRRSAEPIVFRSGNQRAPADLDGYIKAGVPVGIVHNSTDAVWKKAVAYAQRGGKVFVDSGAFGGDPDFDKVLEHYGQFINDVGREHAGNVYIVAPDKVGDAAATRALQQQYDRDIAGFLSEGANVIVPVQVSTSTQTVNDAIDVARQFPKAIIGLPSNKAAISDAQLREVVQHLVTGTGRAPGGFHFLGMGEKNARFETFKGIVREAFPEVPITADSNRTQALMVPGRPTHTRAVELTDERADNAVDDRPAGDTTELAGSFFSGDREAFTADERIQLADSLNVRFADLGRAMAAGTVQELVDESGLEDALMLEIARIAKARMVKVERPGARTDAIAEAEAPKKSGPPRADVTVRETDRNSVEIAFRQKPSPEVLAKVKAAGYRWAKGNKVWYRKGAKLEDARKLVGLDQQQAAATFTAMDDHAAIARLREATPFVGENRAARLDAIARKAGVDVAQAGRLRDEGKLPFLKPFGGPNAYVYERATNQTAWDDGYRAGFAGKEKIVPQEYGAGTGSSAAEAWTQGHLKGAQDAEQPKKSGPPSSQKVTWGHAATMSDDAATQWFINMREEGHWLAGKWFRVRMRKGKQEGWITGVGADGRTLMFRSDAEPGVSLGVTGNQVEPAWKSGIIVTKPAETKSGPPRSEPMVNLIVKPLSGGPAEELSVPENPAKAEARAELNAAVADIQKALRGLKNTLGSGVVIPPELFSAVTRATRALAKLGALEAQDAWNQLVDLIGDDINRARAQVKLAFETAWEATTGNPVEVADTHEKAQTQEQEPTHAARDDQEAVAGDAPGLRQEPVTGATESSPDRRGEPGLRRGERSDSERPEPGSGEGTDAGSVGDSGRAASRRRRAAGSDHVIADDDVVAEGGAVTRTRNNLEAIRLLKQIEAENRPATPDEQTTLAKYVGWGGLANVFNYNDRFYKEVEQALTDEEHAAARKSTTNAHYTSIPVIRAVWDAVERLGIHHGRVLEPSMGVGHFFGAMPPELAAYMTKAGVELDSISGRIATLLYPKAKIQVTGFESAKLPDQFFDLVISNVPFGDYGIHDPKFKGRPRALSSAIHNYFFAKALDKVRPGGLVAFITSHHTLDAKDSTVRQYLADKADFIGAVRLPDSAFKGNAGTEVVTDVIFLRRRAEGAERAGEPFEKTVDSGVTDPNSYTYPPQNHQINEYFAAHPEMVVGVHTNTGKMYGRPGALNVEHEGDFEADLKAALGKLPENVITPHVPKATEPTRDEMVPAPDHVKRDAFVVQDGKLWQRVGDELEPREELPETTKARILGMIEVRDVLRSTMRLMLSEGATDAQITTAREGLNRAYDEFVKRFGYIGDRANNRAFGDDPDKPLLQSLEVWKEPTDPPTKAKIFTERTLQPRKPVTSADSPQAALLATLNDLGRIDLAHMAQLTGQREEDVIAGLAGLIYQTPDGVWQSADQYLSGNVRAKLDEAKAAAAVDPKFQANVDALTAVQPADLTPADIDVRLGASWIPRDVIGQFLAHITDTQPHNWTVSYAAPLAEWKLKPNVYTAQQTAANTTKWGTPRKNADELILDALNLKSPTIYDKDADGKAVVNQEQTLAAREKQQAIKDEFKTWLWADDARATRLAGIYNRDFNNLRLRTFDGQHLTLPGMSAGITLRPHQKDAIWRVLQSPSTGLGHVVGAGKTFEMIGAALELRRLGLVKKPMIAVPNHLVEQWGAEFLRMYPSANVLVATKEDFETANRKRLMSRIATGDWDAVVVAHSSFEMVPISDEAFNAFVQEQIDEYERYIEEVKAEEGKKGLTVKQLEKAKARLEAKLRSQRDADEQDRTLTFEEMGIDGLFVDEAHLFKNLEFATKMTRVAGLPTTGSDRAFDMFLKVRHVGQIGGRVVFATGTPLSNTMAEMFTMQRYLQLGALKDAGLQHFDAWAQQYGETVTTLELAAEGSGYRPRTRFAKFTNLPELLSMFRQSWDILTAKDLKLPTPKIKGGKPQVVAVPASEELKRYVQSLVKRAAAIRGESYTHPDGTIETFRKPEPNEDNMLKVTGDGKKAALDMRLLGIGGPPTASAKIKAAVTEVARIYKANDRRKGTQLIFSDMGTPSSKKGGFNLYRDIRERLVTAGIPKEQIAFIHDAKTDEQKLELFGRVNRGEIRVLIGSTEKMGAGMNVQERLVALHHLDAPWRPSDIEQREGRIVRQGNKFYEADPEGFEVEVLRYVTEGSFDAYSWQTLESKAKFIEQAMRGDVTVRSADDVDGGALTYAEVKALASGNPMVFEKVKVDAELRKLQLLQSAFDREKWQAKSEVSRLPNQLADHEQRIADYQAIIDARQIPDEFTITIGGKTFEKRDDANKALDLAIAEGKKNPRREMQTIGTYAGLDLTLETVNKFTQERHETPRLFVSHDGARIEADTSVGSIEYAVRQRPDDRLKGEQRALTEKQKRLEDLKALAEQPFPQEARIKELRAEQQRLEKALNLDTKGQQAEAAVTGEAEGWQSVDDIHGTRTAKRESEPKRDANRPGPPRSGKTDASSQSANLPDTGPNKPGRVPKVTKGGVWQKAHATLDAIRTIELPELVELAKELAQIPQVVKRFRGDRTGDFQSGGLDAGKIRLHADLFKPGKELELARTLAHEIGHLVDWLPDYTLKRGNLLGHLNTLHRFLKGSIPGGSFLVKNSAVKDELIKVSKAWRGPWTQDGGSYDTYRKSAKELYADAISVLLNNPHLLEKLAPTFYVQFFEQIDKKPDVKAAYFGLQELLSGTRQELIDRRRGGVQGMIEGGDTQAVDLAKERRKAREQGEGQYWMRFRQQLVDKNTPILDRIKKLEKKGVRIPEDEDPRYLLEERSYMGGKQKAFLERYIQPVYQQLQDAGISWTTFGESLFYERIIAGDRSDLANPRGITPAAANEMYADLQQKLSADQLKALERAVIAFRLAAREVSEDAYQAGLYKPELYQQMQQNPAYVPFRVLDHLEKDMSSAVHSQIGTLKDIQNPADAAVLKMLVTQRAAEYNRVKVSAFDFLHRHYPADIEQAPAEWNGNGLSPRPPSDPKKQVLVTYKEQGRTRGKYVDPYIAASLNNEAIGRNFAVIEALRWLNSKLFRPAFTGLNLGFQTFNLARDFMRFWKNTPNMTFAKALKRYRQAFNLARVRAYGLPEMATAPQVQAYQDLIAAEASGVLSLTFNDLMDGRETEDTQIEEIFASEGVSSFERKATPITGRLRRTRETTGKVLDWIKNTGDFIETLPKGAGIYEMADGGSIEDISPAKRSFIRRKVGSPDYLQGGTFKPITNELFLFSNAITQAWRADYEVATDPQTRSGFWWKTAALNVAPKLAIAALLASSIGDDDDDDWTTQLRRMLENISEYDLTNYLPVPVGLDDAGNTVYIRLPQDDSGRLVGGLVWKALKMASGDREAWKGIGQVFDYMAGQAPGVTPSIQAASDAITFASGRNVYDPFRNRFLFTDEEMRAGGNTTKFLAHEFQQLGGSAVWKFYVGEERPTEKTPGQKVLDLPIVSNVAGRWVKVSQQGQKERLRDAQARAASETARANRAERAEVNDAIRQFMAAPPPSRTRAKAQALANTIAAQLYADASPKERQEQAKQMAKKIRMGAQRGTADALTEVVMGSRSTAEKIAVINQHFKTDTAARDAWLQRAVKEDIISAQVVRAVRAQESRP